jgi:uncharacterized protein (TIGR00730 family)
MTAQRQAALAVFCGSSSGRDSAYDATARALGHLLAQSGISLVYGGGRVGLMGAMADACLDAGGAVIGVIPRMLLEREVGHRGVTTLHVVDSMHARKALMADLADGFLALPGGMGTYDELFEIVTWRQLGMHSKPIGWLNVAGYFDRLGAALDSARDEGFVSSGSRASIAHFDTLDQVLPGLGFICANGPSEQVSAAIP